ncbi:MAG TPA: hypothetical protein VIO61_13340 [Anaerolineaceae bacterium]
MNQDQVAFLPFHAINQFMVDEYRETVIRFVLKNADSLSSGRRNSLYGLLKKNISVQGFRNGMQAPLPLKVKSAANIFERKAEFTAQVLQAWSELKPELRQKVSDLLKSRGWEFIPADADRAKLPGFLPDWVKGETYDTLEESFRSMFPGENFESDDLRLMVVWLSGRLPFGMGEDEPEA